MSNSNGIITAPVSIEDVATTLGSGSRDLGTLCKHTNINVWSKYKPVRWNNKPGINLTSAEWWKAEDGSCGINFTNAKATDYAGIIAKFTSDKKNGWVHNPPTGGNYDYRLLDFENYKQDAEPMISSFNVDAKVAEGGVLHAYYDYNESETEEGVPASLKFSDIKADGTALLSSYAFGVVVTDSNGTYKGRALNGSGGLVEYSVVGLTLGSTYKAYPVLAKTAVDQFDEDVTNVFFTLPNAAPAEFKIVTKEESLGLVIELMATYTYTSGKASGISWTLTISNTGTSPYMFNTNTVRCRFTTSSESSSMVTGEQTATIANFTVSASTTATKTGSFTLDYSKYPNKEYYLMFYLNNGTFTKRTDVDAGDMPEA